MQGKKMKEDEDQSEEEDHEFAFWSKEVREKISTFSEFIALDDGKSFGEMALMNNKPRGATILCKENTHFAVMDRVDFQDTLMKLEEKQQDSFINFLRKLQI
jgi:hypothetical protein